MEDLAANEPGDQVTLKPGQRDRTRFAKRRKLAARATVGRSVDSQRLARLANNIPRNLGDISIMAHGSA